MTDRETIEFFRMLYDADKRWDWLCEVSRDREAAEKKLREAYQKAIEALEEKMRMEDVRDCY